MYSYGSCNHKVRMIANSFYFWAFTVSGASLQQYICGGLLESIGLITGSVSDGKNKLIIVNHSVRNVMFLDKLFSVFCRLLNTGVF